MAVTVKKITLWRREAGDRPGLLAETLSPLAAAGVTLGVAMGYRQPGGSNAVIEVALEKNPVIIHHVSNGTGSGKHSGSDDLERP